MATRQKGYVTKHKFRATTHTHTHTHTLNRPPYFHKDFEHVVPLLIIQEQSTIDRG
jgi:hypothetical protein